MLRRTYITGYTVVLLAFVTLPTWATDTMLDVPALTGSPRELQNKLLQRLAQVDNSQKSLYQALSSKHRKLIEAHQRTLAWEREISKSEESFTQVKDHWEKIEGHDGERRKWEEHYTAFRAASSAQRSHINEWHHTIQDYLQWMRAAIDQLKQLDQSIPELKRAIQRLKIDEEEIGPYERRVRDAETAYSTIMLTNNAKSREIRDTITTLQEELADEQSAMVTREDTANIIWQTVSKQVEHEKRETAAARLKAEEEARRQVEADRRKQEQERAREVIVQRQAEEAQRQADQKIKFQTFINQHHAKDLSDYRSAYTFWNNPFAYQGKTVFLIGGYHKHIGPNQAIVAIVPDRNPSQYIVQWDTSRNLAELAAIVNGSFHNSTNRGSRHIGTVHFPVKCR